MDLLILKTEIELKANIFIEETINKAKPFSLINPMNYTKVIPKTERVFVNERIAGTISTPYNLKASSRRSSILSSPNRSTIKVTTQNSDLKASFHPYHLLVPIVPKKPSKSKTNDFILSPKILKITKFLDKLTAAQEEEDD